MGSVSVDQIMVTPLRRVHAAGGDVLHAMRLDDLGFMGFGEAYFSQIELGVVKAWKRHLRMTMNLVVPVGCVRFVFLAEGSSTLRKEVLSETRYARITVPPGIWFGFQGLLVRQSVVLNLSNIPHDPQEVERLPVSEFEYKWKE